MEKVFEVAAHKSDVDDIDISPDGQKVSWTLFIWYSIAYWYVLGLNWNHYVHPSVCLFVLNSYKEKYHCPCPDDM